MSLADRYRRYAAECARVAQESPNAADKALLLEMAEMWRRLAEGSSGPADKQSK
jgi:hypothetical protein